MQPIVLIDGCRITTLSHVSSSCSQPATATRSLCSQDGRLNQRRRPCHPSQTLRQKKDCRLSSPPPPSRSLRARRLDQKLDRRAGNRPPTRRRTSCPPDHSRPTRNFHLVKNICYFPLLILKGINHYWYWTYLVFPELGGSQSLAF